MLMTRDASATAERDHVEAQYLACVLTATDSALGDDAAAVASGDIRQELLRVAYEVACEHHADGRGVHLDLVTQETVRRLGSEQQECVVLRFMHGLSVAETALIMDKKAGAIKALQYRAVRSLARMLPADLHP